LGVIRSLIGCASAESFYCRGDIQNLKIKTCFEVMRFFYIADKYSLLAIHDHGIEHAQPIVSKYKYI